MRKYKIKPSHVIDGLKGLIERTLNDLECRNLLAWYDPNDPFGADPLDIDDVTNLLSMIEGEEMETIDPSQFFVPPGLVMLRGSFGVGGINVNLLDLIAYEVLPKSKPLTNCTHPNKYMNRLSASLVFWVCPDCKQEV